MSAPPQGTAAGEAGIRFMLDTELAEHFVATVKSLLLENRLPRAWHRSPELGPILAEFRRRELAHQAARARYRNRFRRRPPPAA